MGQRHHRLRAHGVPARLNLVVDQPGGRLAVQPLAHQPRISFSVGLELLGAPRSLTREYLVKAELVADPDS